MKSKKIIKEIGRLEEEIAEEDDVNEVAKKLIEQNAYVEMLNAELEKEVARIRKLKWFPIIAIVFSMIAMLIQLMNYFL